MATGLKRKDKEGVATLVNVEHGMTIGLSGTHGF